MSVMCPLKESLIIFVFVLPEFELKHKLKILLFDLYKDAELL